MKEDENKILKSLSLVINSCVLVVNIYRLTVTCILLSAMVISEAYIFLKLKKKSKSKVFNKLFIL